MTSDTHENKAAASLRKLALPLITGGVTGFLLAVGIGELVEGPLLGEMSSAAETALLVGAFYILAGVGVGIGAMRPSLGAKLLNVEDEEELLEQRAMLVHSCIAMSFWGAGLAILATFVPGGISAPLTALLLSAVAMLIGSYFAWRSWKASDELMAAVNSESTAIAFTLTFLVVGGWAMAAHLGLADQQDPIAVLTVFYVTGIFSAFIAAGRRGMLAIR